jgi:hypothetical protein
LHICTGNGGFEKDSSDKEGKKDDCYSKVSSKERKENNQNVENGTIEDLGEQNREDIHGR